MLQTKHVILDVAGAYICLSNFNVRQLVHEGNHFSKHFFQSSMCIPQYFKKLTHT